MRQKESCQSSEDSGCLSVKPTLVFNVLLTLEQPFLHQCHNLSVKAMGPENIRIWRAEATRIRCGFPEHLSVGLNRTEGAPACLLSPQLEAGIWGQVG